MEKKEAIKRAIEFFKNNEDVFSYEIESLDDWVAWLGDERFEDMDSFDDIMAGKTPLEIANCISSDFCIYDKFFKFDAYGNVHSCDNKDYSNQLSFDTILEMAKWVDMLDFYDDEALKLLEDVRDAV